MKKHIVIILFALTLPICIIVAQKPNISFLNLSVKDGLSQNTIIRIFQDSNDYMWFCTRDGLNKYNGTGFEIYRNISVGTLFLITIVLALLLSHTSHE